jgi:hypothetical protein
MGNNVIFALRDVRLLRLVNDKVRRFPDDGAAGWYPMVTRLHLLVRTALTQFDQT